LVNYQAVDRIGIRLSAAEEKRNAIEQAVNNNIMLVHLIAFLCK
tara:strand:+ start:195 stop:326 length:132 start_codon:yes stop_codon:yes gene_type:complete